MTWLDVQCLLAGLVRLSFPVLALLYWFLKKRARLYPALIAFLVLLPVFILGSAIRSGFSQENRIAWYLQQGLLFGILEEGAKYLVLRFVLSDYDSRKDAVTYGIGHSAYEEFAGGIACFGLIGNGNAAPDILPVNLWTAVLGILGAAALTVLVFCGIVTGKTKCMLPAAVLLHAASNACAGLSGGPSPFWLLLLTLLDSGTVYAGYRCWRALEDPYAEK